VIQRLPLWTNSRENCPGRSPRRLVAIEDRRQKGYSVIRVPRIVVLAGLLSVAVACFAQVETAPLSRRQQALALEQLGRTAEAEDAWRAVANDEPSNPEPYAHLGLLESKQQHYKEAIPLYQKALEIGPDIPGVRLNLGLALFKGGELKESIVEFTRLLQSQPDNLQLNTLIGMAYYGLAQYADAVPYLKAAAAHDTQSLPLRLTLAHSCLWSKQHQCVLDTYREILALDPNSAEADMVAGEALDEMKDNEGSTRMFREAVKANPKEPNAHFGQWQSSWTKFERRRREWRLPTGWTWWTLSSSARRRSALFRIYLEKNAEGRAQAEGGNRGRRWRTEDCRRSLIEGTLSPEQLSGITHEDCAEFSRDFGVLAGRGRPGSGREYTLEASSPGLDSKLSKRGRF
jgi:tetratricopeptide (TPR) repeat protein